MIIKKYNRFGLYLFLVFLSCNPNNSVKVNNTTVETDSINLWVKQSQKSHLELKKRKNILTNAFQYTKQIKIDSIRNKNFLKLAYETNKLNDTSLFLKINREALNLSIELKDTFGIADTHWNFASFHRKKEKLDSAYFYYHKAFVNFSSINHDYYSGKMLYNMAFIQSRFKNYTESEILLFQAISIFQPLKKQKNLYLCYNLLGINFNELEKFDKSIFYHNKALEYLMKIDSKNYYWREESLNNLSLVYEKQSNYKLAIFHLNKALKNESLKVNSINQYARLIDNLAFNKFLNGNTKNILKQFNEALKIRDSLHNKSGIAISKIHMAKYFAKTKDTIKAIAFTQDALKLSKEVKNNRDILASLELLSEIDYKNSEDYLKDYIKLNDSLQKAERKIRDKFTRIQYETDEYIQETKILSKQKNQIVIGSLFIIAILTLLFYIKKQQARNKELYLEQKQQKANEEIYNLMLAQQTKKNEGKIQERNRIAEELHDGVLGRLFGTRMGMGFLDVNGDMDAQKKYQSFLDEMQGIEKEIRTISHELKDNLLKDDQSFIEIVRALLSEQKKNTNLDFELQADVDIPWNTMGNSVQMNLYRLIQEALQNINKHAHATKVEVIFSLQDKNLLLTIKDNGIGFDNQKAKQGIGIKNMISRVQKLGGVFKIDSNSGHGTGIEIKIPV